MSDKPDAISIVNTLRNPEEHYPGNFNTAKRAVALLMSLCQEAADEIQRLQDEVLRRAQPAPVAQQPQADLIPEDALFVCGQMGANVTRVYAAAPQQAEAAPPSNLIDPGSVVSFAVDRWLAEVANRPLVNKNRRTLDDTWRQVIRRFGGDPDVLLGPPHDELAAIAQQKGGV